jgi:hypothetical protein
MLPTWLTWRDDPNGRPIEPVNAGDITDGNIRYVYRSSIPRTTLNIPMPKGIIPPRQNREKEQTDMAISIRGDSIKMDADTRALVIDALHTSAAAWLVDATKAHGADATKLLEKAGNAKATAILLTPKVEEE